jgi:hypothetical protein
MLILVTKSGGFPSEKRLQHLDLKQGQKCLFSTCFLFNEKLTKHLLLQTYFFFIFVVIMAAQNEEEIRLEENPEQGPPKEPRQNSEGSSTTQVLETMRNLIVELQVFKADNEKLKKAQQEQQEINEVLLCSIVTKKSPKDNNEEEEVNKRASKNSGPEAEKEDNSSEGTPSTKIKQPQEERGNRWTTWKGDLRKSNRPPLMENPGQGRRLKHGYWT